MGPIVYDVMINGRVVAQNMELHIALILVRGLLDDDWKEVTIRKVNNEVCSVLKKVGEQAVPGVL